MPEARRTTHEPSRWVRRLPGEKSGFVATPRSPTTISAAPLEDRSDERLDIGGRVLAVRVGRDDDVRPDAECRVQAGPPREGEAAVDREAHDVGRARLPGGLGRAVRRAVVHDERLDGVEARDAAGELGEGGADLLRLVPGGNLDDELHLGAEG